jgi:hypothetical protein
METIAFENWRNGRENKMPSASHDDVAREDIITIDSHIELKVRGDSPETRMLNGATEAMEQNMMKFLEHEYNEFRESRSLVLNGTLNFAETQKTNPAFEELKKFHQQKFSEMAALKTKAHRRNKFLFSIQPGFEIIVPPYDSEWSNNFASFSGANKISGEFKSFPLGNGCSASGVGVFLSSASNVSVRFSAHCPISYSWSNFVSQGGGYAGSRGGLGLCIYDASVGAMVKENSETLWDQSRRTGEVEISGGGDDVYFQNTSIGKSYFEMKAGHTYLVWIWCWAFSDSGPNAAAYANVDCRVPFMIVDSSSL